MAKAFPKTIYVKVEPNDDDPWLNVLENAPEDENVSENTRVAVYQLVEVGRISVTRKYEPPRKARR